MAQVNLAQLFSLALILANIIIASPIANLEPVTSAALKPYEYKQLSRAELVARQRLHGTLNLIRKHNAAIDQRSAAFDSMDKDEVEDETVKAPVEFKDQIGVNNPISKRAALKSILDETAFQKTPSELRGDLVTSFDVQVPDKRSSSLEERQDDQIPKEERDEIQVSLVDRAFKPRGSARRRDVPSVFDGQVTSKQTSRKRELKVHMVARAPEPRISPARRDIGAQPRGGNGASVTKVDRALRPRSSLPPLKRDVRSVFDGVVSLRHSIEEREDEIDGPKALDEKGADVVLRGEDEMYFTVPLSISTFGYPQCPTEGKRKGWAHYSGWTVENDNISAMMNLGSNSECIDACFQYGPQCSGVIYDNISGTCSFKGTSIKNWVAERKLGGEESLSLIGGCELWRGTLGEEMGLDCCEY